MTNSIANLVSAVISAGLPNKNQGQVRHAEGYQKYRRRPFHLIGFSLYLILIVIANVGSANDESAPSSIQKLTLFHTNDLQSRLLGFGPNADYSPDIINNDATIGGIARLASLLESRRTQLGSDVISLTLDGGDIMMGTLFHTVSREIGTEFQLLKQLNYDAVTLGNHDFDFRPEGLAAALQAATKDVGLPPIVLSNIRYSAESPRDDELESLAQKGIIKPSLMIRKAGLNIGVIGVLGWHAISVIGEADPLEFADPVDSIKAQVSSLKEQGTDLLILLSHSGVYQKNGQWVGDDVSIAEQIPDLDIIISGHAHIVTPSPVKVGKTVIVQAGSDGRFLGELSLSWDRVAQRLIINDHQVHPINDKIRGSASITHILKRSQALISQYVLAPHKLSFSDNVVKIDKHLSRQYDDYTLGNVASDSLRLAAGSNIAVTTNGEIRDELFPGNTGMQQVSDIFRIFPIGIGYQHDSPGYDLVKVYFTAEEIKNLMEILLVAYQVKGPSFYPRISGVEVSYNPYRLPLDRVTELTLLGADTRSDLDLSNSSAQLYSVTMTHYAFKFMSIIDELSYGLLSAKPKNADGTPVTSVKDILVDSDPAKPGIQRQKAWSALMDYLRDMPDTDGDGVANLQSNLYSEPRIQPKASLTPENLFKNSNGISLWIYAVLSLLILGLSIILIAKRRSKKQQRLLTR